MFDSEEDAFIVLAPPIMHHHHYHYNSIYEVFMNYEIYFQAFLHAPNLNISISTTQIAGWKKTGTCSGFLFAVCERSLNVGNFWNGICVPIHRMNNGTNRNDVRQTFWKLRTAFESFWFRKLHPSANNDFKNIG
jgi:hypothetical protein